MKSVALNEISDNLYDFGISSSLYLSFNLSKNVSFSPNYYQSLLNKTNITYAGFYNPNVINNLIRKGQLIKLSWIAYLNSKFFTADSVQNIEKNELNCSSGKQISPNILAAYPLRLPLNLTDNSLITTIFEEQLVSKIYMISLL